jgi:xanthine/CO dehydrogenase XdhC/CoxF family maturation factor
VEKEVIDNLGDCLRADTPVALVTVIDNGNSSRGQSGAMMVIWGESESCGSVGCGSLEFWATGEARKCLAAGLSREKLDAVYAPMGLNIATVKPKEIALSIMSEILLVKNNGSTEHMRTVKNISY